MRFAGLQSCQSNVVITYDRGNSWTLRGSGVGPERDDVAPKRKKSMVKISVWLSLGGAVFAFSPILLALTLGALSGDSESAFNEGSGFGALIWLMFFTFPIGAIVVLVGLVLLVVSLIRRRRAPGPSTPLASDY